MARRESQRTARRPARPLVLQDLGWNLAAARAARGLTQAVLAGRCGLSQNTISSIESGHRRPTLDLLFRITRALDVSIQRLISGSDRPGDQLRDIAIELKNLGIADLWVQDAAVPCAFRRPEEVIVLAIRGEPDPRVVTALPVVLARNAWDRRVLKAFSRAARPLRRVIYRLAWLADIALAIDRRQGFPGGCRTNQLAGLVRSLEPPREAAWDSLGSPMKDAPRSALWRRWRINYDMSLEEFEARAMALAELDQRTRSRPIRLRASNDPGGKTTAI